MKFQDVENAYRARNEDCIKIQRDKTMTEAQKKQRIKDVRSRYALSDSYLIEDTVIVKNVFDRGDHCEIKTNVTSFRAPKKPWVMDLKIGQRIGVYGKFKVSWEDDRQCLFVYPAGSLLPKMFLEVNGKRYNISSHYFEL